MNWAPPLKPPYPVLASRVDWGVDTPSPMIRLIFLCPFFPFPLPATPSPDPPFPPGPNSPRTGEAVADRRESIEQVSVALPVLSHGSSLPAGWLRGSDMRRTRGRHMVRLCQLVALPAQLLRSFVVNYFFLSLKSTNASVALLLCACIVER